MRGRHFPATSFQKVSLIRQDRKPPRYWPSPNLPGTLVPGTSTYAPVNNAGLTAVAQIRCEEITIKVDHNFSGNKRAFVRYAHLYNVAGSANYFNNLADEGYGPMTVHSQNAAIGYTQTFGSSTVLDLRGGINRFTAFRPSNGLGFKITDLGLPASLQNFLEQGDVDEFPGTRGTRLLNLGNNNGPYYSSNQLNYNFSGSVSRVIGKHTLTVGGEHRDYFLAFLQTNPLLMNFANDMTQGAIRWPCPRQQAMGLLPCCWEPAIAAARPFTPIRPTPITTLASSCRTTSSGRASSPSTSAFRLEEETGTTERYNRMAAIDPYVLNPISNQVTNPFTGQTPWNLYGGYVFAGNGPDSLSSKSIRGIEFKPSPRIGIAYSLNDKTVIRTGYGIFYGVPYAGATREFTSTAFQTTTTWVTDVDNIHPTYLFSNPFPSGFLYPPGSSQGLLSVVGQSLSSALPSTLKTPYNQQWNFSIQRSLGSRRCCCRSPMSAIRGPIWLGVVEAAQPQ